jgi:hypothetical protein
MEYINTMILHHKYLKMQFSVSGTNRGFLQTLMLNSVEFIFAYASELERPILFQ